jgi:hypothetical protein
VVHLDGLAPAAEPTWGDGTQYVVQPGDSLSGIVEELFPTATRTERAALVSTVFAANRGATDPRGRPLDHPDLIHPGMVLTLPTMASPAIPPAAPPPPVVEPAPAAPPRRVPAPPPERRPDVTPRRPPTSGGTPAPASSVGSASTTTTTATTTTMMPTAGPDDAVTPPWVAASGVAGTALLATGLGVLVASRQRQRLRASRPGETVRPFDQAAAVAAETVRRVSDAVAAARLDLALRALAYRLRDSAARPQVVVQRDDGAIDVHLDRPRALDAPWIPRGEGSVAWTLPADSSWSSSSRMLPASRRRARPSSRSVAMVTGI